MLIQSGCAPAQTQGQAAAAAAQWYTFPQKHTDATPAVPADFTRTLSQAQTVTETARQNYLAGTVSIAEVKGAQAFVAGTTGTAMIDSFISIDPAKVAQLFG